MTKADAGNFRAQFPAIFRECAVSAENQRKTGGHGATELSNARKSAIGKRGAPAC